MKAKIAFLLQWHEVRQTAGRRTFLLSPLVRSLIRAEPALELLQYTKRIVINPPLIQKVSQKEKKFPDIYNILILSRSMTEINNECAGT